MKVTQSCPTLCGPMDYTVHGILQDRILEWVAFPFFKGSSQPRDQIAPQADSLPAEPQGKPKNTGVVAQSQTRLKRLSSSSSLSLLQQIFQTQESNWGLLHFRRILYQVSYRGSSEDKCTI